MIDVCLTGAFLVLKHGGARIADGGALVSLSSLNARQPGTGMAAYCSAKAGLVMLTQVAALELASRRVRVNAVSPGLVVTPLTAPAMDIPGIRDSYLENTPLGRSGEPAEVAALQVGVALQVRTAVGRAGLKIRYSPVNVGRSRLRNAATAPRWSRVRPHRACATASSPSISSSVRSWPVASNRLDSA